jgi:hypothetical protein
MKKDRQIVNLISWLGWRDSNPRMPVPKLESVPSTHTLIGRATEVRQFVRARERQWMLGAVAVSAAVKDTQVDEGLTVA